MYEVLYVVPIMRLRLQATKIYTNKSILARLIILSVYIDDAPVHNEVPVVTLVIISKYTGLVDLS